MTNPITVPAPERSLLRQIDGAEKLLLSGRRNREADVESAVRFFLEFLHGFESFDFQVPYATVYGRVRFPEDHRYYRLARAVGSALAQAGYAMMTGGFGTLDEAFEIATLQQNPTLERCPLIACGQAFWDKFVAFVQDAMLNEGTVRLADLEFVLRADSADELVRIVRECGVREVPGTQV